MFAFIREHGLLFPGFAEPQHEHSIARVVVLFTQRGNRNFI